MCRYESTNNERRRAERKKERKITACKGEEEIKQSKAERRKGKERKGKKAIKAKQNNVNIIVWYKCR